MRTEFLYQREETSNLWVCFFLKLNSAIHCLQDIHLVQTDNESLKIKEWAKIYEINVNKKAHVMPLISDKANFNTET